MARKTATVSDMLKYADSWVNWFDGPRKCTAILFRDTLLKMTQEEPFALESYNHLIDISGEREETRADAKKMARILYKSWVWDEEKAKQIEEEVKEMKKEDPFSKVKLIRVHNVKL